MSSVTEIGSFPVPAAQLWALVSDFGGIDKILPGVASLETEGEGVGMLRKVPAGESVVIESLDVLDHDSMTLTYSIVSGPLPFEDYSATMVVTEDDAEACTLTWTGSFEPSGVPAEKAEGLARKIYAGGIVGFANALGVEASPPKG